MNYWKTYESLFKDSIEPKQKYQITIKQILQQVDQAQNPCQKQKHFEYLQNQLKTKSESCSRLKKLVPFSTNYRGETLKRSNFFQREQLSVFNECIMRSQKQNESLLSDIKEKSRRFEDNKINIEKMKQQFQQKLIQAKVNPQSFRNKRNS